jgi:hypothetical protein
MRETERPVDPQPAVPEGAVQRYRQRRDRTLARLLATRDPQHETTEPDMESSDE